MTKESGDSSKKEVSTISTTQFQCQMLKPSNYSSWAIQMQIILEANGLWEMIEPLETTQSDNKKDKSAIAFLYQVLLEEQLLQITKHKTAKAIWDALKTRHIDLDEMSVDEAIGRLKTFEERFKSKKEILVDSQKILMFTRHEGQRKPFRERGRFNQSRGREQDNKQLSI
ncbi:zinc finger, CCHC-type containing protein [Tanacetum coccineum]